MKWWKLKHNNEVHKLIIQALPIFICWNLWKNRVAVKYGGNQSSVVRVKYLIFKDISHLLNTAFSYLNWPDNWKDLIIMVEGCQHETKIIPLSWDRPHSSIYKLNTDGSALSNPGKIGGGGILRNDQGKMIYAF